MNYSLSQALFDRALQVSPGGVHSPVRAFRGVGGPPRFIRHARGSRIMDVDGNSYIDFCMSWGPLLFGHQDPEVRSAVDEALSRGWSYGAAEAGSLELAEFIAARLRWVEKIRFVNSGTEAVMSALRVARAATGRAKILKFYGCYHGHADSMLVKAGSGLAEMAALGLLPPAAHGPSLGLASPDSAGVTAQTAADTLVAPLDDTAALERIWAEHGQQIAAVIVEPLPANYGLLPQRQSFFATLIPQARKAGALVIFDEVISGFRVGMGGMAQELGIEPDLLTFGKVIGGGFPVGAYGGKAELMDLVAPVGPVYQAGTLSANPVAMAAGLAMLRKLEREAPFEALAKRTLELKQRLEERARAAGEDGFQVQCHGSLFWTVFGPAQTQDGVVRAVGQIPARQGQRFTPLFHALLKRGIYLTPSGYEVGFLSTAHTDADLEATVEACTAAWAETR